jgi:hypothetical protein
LLLILGPPLSVYLRSPENSRQYPPSSFPHASWGALIVLLFFVALGIGFLAKPLAVLDRVSPRKHSAEPEVQRNAYKLRILGGLLLFASVLGMCVQLLRYFQH